ncbi:anthranilate phosphoribosyltransferase [Pseudalkalibacillus decolorationis]|uniref:anthranilate phosphoribosyltransferase n=1 Tax=Pseudalkalibacillus decolorationis TaxID=163879 RepID=UPI002148A2D0|nr:anthranilate phosphoribosyltransferase [Pseudalkalibacillus decolorationis]
MKQWIKEVGRGKRGARDLEYNEALQAADSIINGGSTDVQIAAFLVAERIKTESSDELLAFIDQYRASSHRLPFAKESKKVIDFAGPYDGRKTFAATIPVSILLSESGVPVFLHGSDPLPPKNGVSIKSIFENLHVPIAKTVKEASESLERANIGFACTEKFCISLANLRQLREQIGVRTVLNTVEKLLNLSNAKSIMLGVFHKTAVNKLIPIMQTLAYEEAFIVQGVEGSEDLPVHRNSFIYKITNDSSDSMIVNPEEYGLKRKQRDEKEFIPLEEQVAIIQRLLDGEQSDDIEDYRAQVIFNAGVRYYLFGYSNSIEEGIQVAKRQLIEKKGTERLERWQNLLVTNSLR